MARNTHIEAVLMDYPLTHPFRSEAERLKIQFYRDAFVDDNGVVYWKSNKKVPPEEIVAFWEFCRFPFNAHNSRVMRDEQNRIFFENYRRNQRPMTEEELFEARAVFGAGTVIVDAISGRKTKL